MTNLHDIKARVGTVIGVSDWVEISQQRIDAFADVTEDWQPIHLDPAVGQAAGFGGTVAHGFLTLSMLSAMSYQVLEQMEDESASLNYGFDRIRFIAPVAGGARLRGHFTLADVTERGDNGAMLRFDVTVEAEGVKKPALTADWLCLYLFN
ncbi:MAG: MaoC family dehydratase [Roseobacter sp.]|jgi:acyl dehydratase|nr:MaoC family dehydratase [Roseobacter sp.]